MKTIRNVTVLGAVIAAFLLFGGMQLINRFEGRGDAITFTWVWNPIKPTFISYGAWPSIVTAKNDEIAPTQTEGKVQSKIVHFDRQVGREYQISAMVPAGTSVSISVYDSRTGRSRSDATTGVAKFLQATLYT